MKLVGTYVDQSEAKVVVSYLESVGINPYLPDEHSLDAIPYIGLAAGHYRVMVPDDEYHAATRHLSHIEKAAKPAAPRRKSYWFIFLWIVVTFWLLIAFMGG